MSGYETQSDSDVVRVALDDKEAFGVLIVRYEAKLSRYLTRLGIRTKEDREDLLQDIFIKVYRNLNGFDQSLSFSSWIYRIAHNECMSWYRKKNARPEGHMIDEGEVVLLNTKSILDANTESEQRLTAEEVSRALAALERKYADVIVLRYFEHKEYQEISDILKIPVGSVATLLHRAKKRLKDSLAHVAPEEVIT